MNAVEFEKDASISGSVHVTTPDARLGNGQVLVLDADVRQRQYEFPETLSARVNVVLNFAGTPENLPPGRAQRTAAIQATLRLKGPKNGGGDIRVETERALVYVQGNEEPEPLRCDDLFTATGRDRKLTLRFTGFRNLLSCRAEKNVPIAHFDPERIGDRAARDVSAGQNRYSEADDARMGREYAEEFLAQNRQHVLDASHPATRWAQSALDRIADASDRPDLRPTVYVINADVLNAFALPGGYIFVFRGLIDAARSEAEILGVLGHEWAHVTARHGTKNVSRALRTMKISLGVAVAGIIASGVGQVTDRAWLALLGEAVANLGLIGGQVYLLNKSREAETEADRLGSQYAWAIDYQPWGLADMFSVMMARIPGANRLDDAVSSHPAMPKRIANVLNWSAFFYPGKRSYVATTAEFEHARRELSILPKPTTDGSNLLGNALANHVQGKANAILEAQANQDRAVIVATAIATEAAKGLLGGRKKKDEKKEGDRGSEE